MLKTGKLGIATAAMLATMLLVAGCGGSSKPKTAPNSAEQRKADLAVGKQAVLKLSDLPPGYKATPHVDDSDNDTPKAVIRKFATCAKVSESQAAELVDGIDDPGEVQANSADFEREDIKTGYSSSLENTVSFLRSADDVSEPFKFVESVSVLPCWKDLFRSVFEAELEPGVTLSNLSVKAIDTGDIADQSAGLAVRAQLAGEGRTLTIYIDLYLAGSGRAGISLEVSGVGERVESEDALALLQTVADRVEGTS